MRAKRLAMLSIICTALIAVPPAPTRAGGPSAQELASLAPIIDNSDRRSQAIDVAGQIGDDKGPGPRLMFHAIYRAPDRSAFLLSDATDGTPLAFGSGKKMFVYDPVGPAVIYSEDASFSVELACDEKQMNFQYRYLPKSTGNNKIMINLKSVMSLVDRQDSSDQVVALGESRYKFTRKFDANAAFIFNVDRKNNNPYSSAAFHHADSSVLRFDKLAIDAGLDDAFFAFPSKWRPSRKLPVRDVTRDEDPAKIRDMAEVVGRAGIVRMIANQAGGPAEASKIPGLSGIDWDRVRENDREFSPALREFVPPNLRAR